MIAPNVQMYLFLAFALSHTLIPVYLQRIRPTSASVMMGHLFPPAMIILMIFPDIALWLPNTIYSK